MPSSVKQMYAIVAGVSLLALLGFVFAPHIFAAWVDAPNNPPTYGATGCSPAPCSEDDFKPVTQTTANQSKQGWLAIGTSAAPAYTVDVAGDVNITGSYRINGVSLTQGGGSVLSGAGTANYLSKWTNGTALGDSLVFDNGTNVGIGISSGFNPLVGNKLEVDGAILGRGFFDQNNTDYYLDPASSVSGNLAGTLTTVGINTSTLRVRGGTPATGNVLTSDEFGNATWGQGGYWTLSGTDIYNSNTGNVGIGTVNPTGKLQIGTLSSGINGSINGANNPTRLIVNGASGSEAALTLGHYSAGYGLDLWVPANPSAPWPTYIDNINAYSGFRFRNNTSATPVELMTIDATGNVGIGTTVPAAKLDVVGTIKASGGYVGNGPIPLTPHYVNRTEDTYSAYVFSHTYCTGYINSDTCPGNNDTDPYSCSKSEARTCTDVRARNYPRSDWGWCGIDFVTRSVSCNINEVLSTYDDNI